jgi:hypothetical protein
MKRDSFQKFLQTFRADLPPNNTFFLQTIDGGTNPQTANKAGLEAVSTVTLLTGSPRQLHKLLRFLRALTYNTRSVLRQACQLLSSPLATISRTATLRDFWTSPTF